MASKTCEEVYEEAEQLTRAFIEKLSKEESSDAAKALADKLAHRLARSRTGGVAKAPPDPE